MGLVPSSSQGGGGSGAVNSVTAGDSSITVAGTAADPTVAVAALGVSAAKIANATITDTQVAAANKDGTAGTASLRTLGTTSVQACAGNDSRLSDARAPAGNAGGDLTGSTYPNPVIANLAVTDAKVAAANKDGAAGTPSMRTLGTTSAQACAGNDARLSDARTPTGAAGGSLNGTYPNPGLADTAPFLNRQPSGNVTMAAHYSGVAVDYYTPSGVLTLQGDAVLAIL